MTTATPDPLGARSALDARDLGSGFSVYAKAKEWQPVGAESCSVEKGSPLGTADHAYAGAQLKDPKGVFFVYSQSFVFRNAALAKTYADFRDSKAFRTCKVAQDQEAERTRNPKISLRLTDATYADRHVTSFYREVARAPDANSQPVDQAEYDRYTYLRGRVVVVISIDLQIPSTAEAEALNQRITAAFNAAVEALDARVPDA